MVLSQHQKFHKSHVVAQELASLASEVGMSEFQSRLAVLKDLRGIWAKGKTAVVLLAEEHMSSGKIFVLKS